MQCDAVLIMLKNVDNNGGKLLSIEQCKIMQRNCAPLDIVIFRRGGMCCNNCRLLLNGAQGRRGGF